MMDNIHINRSEGTMSDGTTDGTGKSEPRVKAKALNLGLRGCRGYSSGRRSHCGGDECARHKGLGMEKEQALLY
jgi:hypothetical protein